MSLQNRSRPSRTVYACAAQAGKGAGVGPGLRIASTGPGSWLAACPPQPWTRGPLEAAAAPAPARLQLDVDIEPNSFCLQRAPV